MTSIALDYAALGIPTERKVHQLSVTSSTKIRARVTGILEILADQEGKEKLEAVVCLTAKSSASNKLISIVEIVKRELVKKLSHDGAQERQSKSEATLFQYSTVKGIMEDQELLEKARRKSAAGRMKSTANTTTKRKSDDSECDNSTEQPAAKRSNPDGVTGEDPIQPPKSTDGKQEEDNGEHAFETIERDTIQKLEGKPPRETPILITFLSRKALGAMRESYGCVMNTDLGRPWH